MYGGWRRAAAILPAGREGEGAGGGRTPTARLTSEVCVVRTRDPVVCERLRHVVRDSTLVIIKMSKIGGSSQLVSRIRAYNVVTVNKIK